MSHQYPKENSEELAVLEQADGFAMDYIRSVDDRRVFPDAAAIDALRQFDEPLPKVGHPSSDTVAFLNRVGTPATVTSNGPHYYGFVIGATLPAAAAAERLVTAWDQCASGDVNSPAAGMLERVAGAWVLQALDLPAGSAVSFGTSATACGLACLATARRALLERIGWRLDEDGLHGGPKIRVVVSASVHVTIKKILRLLGFGKVDIDVAPVDACNRIDPARLPRIDNRTILCLQAGEVNTGEFDPFEDLIGPAQKAGAWVHVDGAFGLWARAAQRRRHLTLGVEAADSWTTDGHKWLNTPYDSAMGICRYPEMMSQTMNADAAYATAEPLAQKNLTTEFSRRPRGISVWAALRTLGRDGLDDLVERHCRQAKRLADGLSAAGLHVLNRVVLNQVLARADTDDRTKALLEACQQSGDVWFGPGAWQGRPAVRLSVSSWRTTDADIERAIDVVRREWRRL